jgi:hypothetical protein
MSDEAKRAAADARVAANDAKRIARRLAGTQGIVFAVLALFPSLIAVGLLDRRTQSDLRCERSVIRIVAESQLTDMRIASEKAATAELRGAFTSEYQRLRGLLESGRVREILAANDCSQKEEE